MSTCMTTGIFASTCCPKCRGVSGLDEDCSHVNILGHIIEKSVSESGGTTMSITVAATSFFILVTWTLSSHRYDRPRLPTRVPNRWVILVLIASHSDVRMIAFGSALLSSVRYSSMPVDFKHSASDGSTFFYLFLSDKSNLEDASSTMRGRA